MKDKGLPAYGIRPGRTVMIAVTAAWVLFIFWSSLKTGEQSSASSGAVLGAANTVLETVNAPFRLTAFIIRKSAHFFEYTVLGILLCTTLRRFTRRVVRHVVYPLFFGLLISVTDEMLQMLIPGRSSAVSDALLDFAGVSFGTAAVIGICALYDARCAAKEQVPRK